MNKQKDYLSLNMFIWSNHDYIPRSGWLLTETSLDALLGTHPFSPFRFSAILIFGLEPVARPIEAAEVGDVSWVGATVGAGVGVGVGIVVGPEAEADWVNREFCRVGVEGTAGLANLP